MVRWGLARRGGQRSCGVQQNYGVSDDHVTPALRLEHQSAFHQHLTANGWRNLGGEEPDAMPLDSWGVAGAVQDGEEKQPATTQLVAHWPRRSSDGAHEPDTVDAHNKRRVPFNPLKRLPIGATSSETLLRRSQL